MKYIPLTMHQVAMVDDDDHVWLSRHKWRAQLSCGKYYAQRGERIGKKVMQISMTWEIMYHNGLVSAYQMLNKRRLKVLFRNGNTLDYRKFNLYIP